MAALKIANGAEKRSRRVMLFICVFQAIADNYNQVH